MKFLICKKNDWCVFKCGSYSVYVVYKLPLYERNESDFEKTKISRKYLLLSSQLKERQSNNKVAASCEMIDYAGFAASST